MNNTILKIVGGAILLFIAGVASFASEQGVAGLLLSATGALALGVATYLGVSSKSE